MRRSLAAFLLSLGFFLSVGSFGFSMTDEAELGAAAYNLYRGSLTVDEVPEEYYQYPSGMRFKPRVTFLDDRGFIAESRGTVALGAPAYAALRLAEPVLSVQGVFALLGTASLAGGAALALEPRWRRLDARTRTRAAVAAAALALAVLAGSLALSRAAPLAVWGPPIAVQLATMLVAAAGVAAFHRFVHLRTGDAGHAHLAAALLAGGTTLAFWASGQKYHAAVIAAGCGILLVRFSRPHPPPLAGWAAAYVLAGLAMWMHAKAGGLLLLTLLAVDALRFLRPRARPRRPVAYAAVLGAALLVGLAPYAAENALLYGTPLVPGYVGIAVAMEEQERAELAPPPEEAPPAGSADAPTAPSAPSAGPTDRLRDALTAALAPLHKVRVAILGNTAFKDTSALPKALVEGLVVPTPRFIQWGLFMIAPLLVLAIPGAWSRLRGGRADELDAALLVHAALILAVYGLYAVRSASYDPRYYSPLFPALVWYAAGHVRERLPVGLRRFAVVAAAVVAATLAVALAWLAVGHARVDYWAVLHVGRALGLAALVLVVGSALLGAWAARREDVDPRLVPRMRVAAWSFALVPPAYFTMQYGFLFPRYAWAGIEDPSFVMFMPTSQLVRDALLRLLGL